MDLNWIKCTTGDWCNLQQLNVNSDHFNDLKGVYIIFSGENVIRLGSGVIKDRLNDHKGNPEITKHPNLKVTWARVNGNQMEGVEKFLSDKLAPLIGERFPDRTPIEVNLPWS